MLKIRLKKAFSVICAVAITATTLITGTVLANAQTGCPFGDWSVLCDFDDTPARGLGYNSAVNSVRVDYSYNLTENLYCSEGKVLEWKRAEGAAGNPEVQISFTPVTTSNYNALTFWFKNTSETDQKLLMGLRDRANADVVEFYQLKYSADAYAVDNSGNVSALAITASQLIIPGGFEGWIQMPFASFTRHTGYPLDNNVMDVTGIYQLQFWYNPSEQSGPYYVDNIGFIKDTVLEFESVSDNAIPLYRPVVDNDTIKHNTYFNNGTFATVADVSPYGNAMEWTGTNTNGTHTQMNCYFTARSDVANAEALVFWISVEAAQKYCVAIVDSKNTSKQECWYLKGSNYPYYTVDAAGSKTEKLTSSGTVSIDAGFAGWVVIPLTSLLQNGGWSTDNAVLDIDSISQFQMWHNTVGTVQYIDEVGFTDDIDTFAAYFTDKRKADFVFTNDITAGSLSVNNAETALSNVSPYGNSIVWASDDENESAIKVLFEASSARANAQAVAVWLSCETSLDLSVSLAGENISYTMDGTNPVYFMYDTHTSAVFMADKTVTVPAGFNGWVIMPIENFNSSGTEVLTAAITEIKLSAKNANGFVCVVDEFAFLKTKKEFAESIGSNAFLTQKSKPNTVLLQGFDDINNQKSGDASDAFDLRKGNSPYGLSMMWQLGYSESGNKDFYVKFPFVENAIGSNGLCFWIETGNDINASNPQFSIFVFDYANVTGAGTECWYPKGSQQSFYFIDETSGKIEKRFTSGRNIVLESGAKGWVYIPFESLEMHATSYAYDNGVIDPDRVNNILIRNSLTSQKITMHFDEFAFVKDSNAFFTEIGTDVNLLENMHILNGFNNSDTVINQSYQNADVTVNGSSAIVSNINEKAVLLIQNTYNHTDKLDKVSSVALKVKNTQNATFEFALNMNDQQYKFGNDDLSLSYVTLCNTLTKETVTKPVIANSVSVPSGFEGYVILPLWAFDLKQEFTAQQFADVTAITVSLSSESDVELGAFTAVDSVSDYINTYLGCANDTDYLFESSNKIVISGKTVTVIETMSTKELAEAFATRRGARIVFEDENGVRVYGYSESIRDLAKIDVYIAGTVVASYNIVYNTASVIDNTNISFFISTEDLITINTSKVKVQIKMSSGSTLPISLNLSDLSDYYLMDARFNCTQIKVTDNTMIIPENFFGWIIIPYSQIKNNVSVIMGLETFNGAKLISDNGEALFTDCSAYSSLNSAVNGAELDMNANAGDIDGDGFTGVKDCIYIKKYLLDIVYAGNTCVCDTNKDSTIDIRDIIRLKQIIA